MESLNDRVLGEAESDVETLALQAGAQLNEGNFEAAIALYDRALALDAARTKDWINRGLALWSLHRNEAALESFDRALALDPCDALAWLNRGNVLSALARPQPEVLECYDRALEIDSQLPRAWFNKGDELARVGRFIEAKACFENARDLATAQADGEVAAKAGELVGRCEHILMNESYG